MHQGSAPFPLSAAQRGIWFAQHFAGSAPISIAQYVELNGVLDVGLLNECSRIAGREFGTGFLRLIEIDDLPFQVVDTTQDEEVVEIDLRTEQDPEAAAHEWMREEYSAPLDLIADRLVNVALLRVGDDRYFWYTRIHHIVLDGFGAVTLINRISDLYNAVVEGREPEASKADDLVKIVDADSAYRSSDRFKADGEYWREHLAGMADAVSLAGRTAEVDAHPRLVTGSLPAETAELLDVVAKAQNSSIAPIVVAAFGAYLGRMASADEVLLSLPVSARTTAVMRRSGGMLANVVPLRLQLGQLTVGELILKAQSELTGALRRQRYRQEDIVRDLGWAMDEAASFGPSVNLMMVDTRLNFGSVTGRLHVLTSGLIDDLFINLYPGMGGESTHIDFQANPNLYTRDELQAQHSRFVAFLHTFLAAGVDAALASLDVLTDDERAMLLPVRGPASEQARTLPDLLARGVAVDPDHVAVRWNAESLTYRELDELSNRLGRKLIGLGAGPGSTVAVAIGRSLESVVATWGVVKSGAAFVPVDPTYPADRIEHMVSDSGAVVGLTVSASREGLPNNVEWIILDAVEGFSAAAITDAERLEPIRLDDAAYMIYTSGSTGLPKGVVVAHRGLANMVASGAEALQVSAASVVAHAVSPSFDTSIEELFMTFVAGATLAVVPPGLYGGDDLADVLSAHRVSVLEGTPSVVATLDPQRVPDLQSVVVGGDACPPDLVTKWTGKRLLNSYGPTEATVAATFTPPMVPGGRVSIGSLVRGHEGLVLDGQLRPVPIGAVGELYLAGPGLARGYHNRFAQTADRFVANPFGAPGARMYRSGDLVRWNRGDDELWLEFLGRSDFQVKVRGYRIELGEIDAALQAHDDVDFAITIGVKTPAGATALAAYVVGTLDAAIVPDQLKSFVGEFLPAYMVPASIMVLDAVPLTPVGKVDRKALPAPDFGSRSTVGRAPTNAREEVLERLFADVLGLESVGVDESFFALGGDSIVSIQLVARAKAAGLAFSARDVFERKTIAGLAAVATVVDAAQALVELPGGGVGEVPITPVIAAMVETAGSFDRFSQSVLLPLPPGVDEANLAGAVQALLDRHDMLRSRLVTDADGGWQIVVDPPRTIDAATLLDHVVGPIDEFSVERELQRAADLLNPHAGAVARFVWLDSVGADGLLWMVLHHLVVDGVSWRILLPDFATAWTQIVGGQEPSLAPVATSFRRWAHGQRDTAQLLMRTAELPAWQAILATEDPILGERAIDPVVDVYSTMQHIETTIPANVAGVLLTQVPERFHCGADDALLTALAMAVTRWRYNRGIHSTSTLLTLEGHGREENVVPGADIARTVGWFTSVYPIALDLSAIYLDDAFAGGPSAGASIKAIKEQLRSVPDRGVGYGMLRYLDAEAGSLLAAGPTPQISFNYLGRSGTGGSDGPFVPRRFASTQDPQMALPAVIDINAITEDTGDGARIAVTWAYASKIIDAEDVAELAELWGEALAALAEHAQTESAGGRSPSDFGLIDATQAQIELWEAKYPTMIDAWPLSPLQFGLLFHALYDTDTADGYTVQATLTLEGAVDAQRLRKAGQGLVVRHENLRVAFVETVDGPRQIVLPEAELPWTEVDLTTIADEDERALELERVVAADASTRFDLTQPPLLRFTFIRTGADTFKLLLTNHHVALDGWSTPLLVKELLTLYVTSGDMSVLPPARSYKEFLAWLNDQDLAASKAAWAEALSGIDAPTRAVPSLADIESTETGQVETELSMDTAAALTDLGKSLGVTVNTAVQAAWALLLAMLTGRTDVVFGGTVSGRPPQLAGVEDMVGLFINTVPVRVQLNPAETVTELLVRIQSNQATMLDHQHIGLADIHQAVGLPELFDTLTVFESYPIDTDALAATMDIAGMRIVAIEGTDATPYPLNLMVIPENSGTLRIALKYIADETGRTAATVLLDRFVNMLTQIAENPTARVASLQSCDAAERSELLPVVGPPSIDFVTMPEIFANAARIDPDAVAAISGDTALTFRELDRWSNRLARVLLRRGVGPDRFVALALTRSMESVVGIWAVAKTGAAFAPMDPNHPPERIEHMVTDSQATIGITTTALGQSLPGSIDWLLLDDMNTIRRVMTISDAPITDAERGATIHVDQTAYLIYTSGSTGKPKAVLLTHRGLANLTEAQRESLALTASSRVLQVASPSFDASVFELLCAHGSGARVVIAPPEVYGGPDLENLLRTEGVTHAVITPSALATMDPAGLDDLQTLAVAGEASGPELVERWSPGRSLVNLYGPTEFSIWATGSGKMAAGQVVTIGGPIRGASLMVLDSWLRPVPRGVSGELYLAGPGLSRGYFNRMEMTSTRFIANPYGAPGERMYRTGDMVRWAPDALELEYMGRSDFQVKIRGLRIELGEIDAVLSRDDEVEYAATIGRAGPAGSTVLVSYVLPAQGITLDTERLRERIATTLPGYMVPGFIVVLDDIPLTPVGKLDRKALPVPDFAATSRKYLAPRTDVERAVANVIAEVLEVERVSIDASFFDLGGNSLIATRVIARINAALGSSVTLRDLFDAPTTALLAMRISTGGGTERQVLMARERPDRVLLSFAQQRMWIINQLDPGSATYNITAALRLTGPLDVAALQTAVADVIERHETLRTVYPSDDAGPVQQIVAASGSTPDLMPDIITDLGELSAAVRQVAGTGFDITRETPLRARLFQVAPQVHVVVLVVHHISADGTSMTPLARDLVSAYAARAAGVAPFWDPLEVQYADFALWQREVLGEESDPESLSAKQIDFWKTNLADLPDQLELPIDKPRPAVQSAHSVDLPFAIDAGTHARVVERARAENVSVFMVVHAALAILLARIGSTQDVTIGTPIAGRGEQVLDDVVGMFVNTLALRAQLEPDMTFAELLDQVRTRDLDAFANADVPFERLVQALNPVRSTAHHPIFQVSLSLQNFAEPVIDLGGLTVTVEDLQRDSSQFDLSLTLRERFAADGSEGGLDGELTYATDLFSPDTAHRFGTWFTRILEAICTNREMLVGSVDLLDDIERAALVPVTGSAGVEPITLAELFGAAAQTYAERTAVVAGSTTLTFRELDERSNQLARLLIQAGAGPESVVALALKRSLQPIVAVWAVAKTGAAFVPIDPNHPAERIEHMLTDSGATVGVTVEVDRRRLPDNVSWLVADDDSVVERMATVSPAPIAASELLGATRLDTAAYVIYTSGSTGLPKGVVVTHRGIANLVRAQREGIQLDAESRVLQVASPSFDASLFEMTMAFGAGAALIVSPATVFGGSDLADLIREHAVSHAVITPSALSSIDPAEVAGLAVLAVAGEAVSPDLVGRWADGRALINLYGPTEFTIWATGSTPLKNGAPITIGGPVTGSAALVLDERLRPVPMGIAGELYLAGPALARGYHLRPDLTASRFVANPFDPSQRMYRTGDVVRWTHDYTLDYVGRSDFQVKVRGLRIELGEIDAALMREDDVEFATTLGVDGPSGATVLVSYVVPTSGATIDPTGLKERLAAQLPNYMVPTAIVELAAIPLTAVGKLDRKALPAPVFETRAFRAPETDAERALVEVYAQVLGIADVGVDDSFFELGGDSILAIQLVSRAKARGFLITAGDVFERRTVAGLIEAAAANLADAVPPLDEMPGGGVGDIPLTPVMEYLLRQPGGNSRFAQSVVLRLPVGIDRDGVVATVAAVVDRHDMLRARLTDEESGLRLETLPPGSVDVDSLVHRVEVDATMSPAELTTIATAELNAAVGRLQPADGVVLQCVWLDPIGRLIVVVHHVAVDGVSWRILVPDFVTAWAHRTAGQQPELAASGTSMRTWAHALREPERVHARAEEMPLWRDIVDGPDPLLSTRAFDPAVDVKSTVREIRLDVSGEITRSLLTAVPAVTRGGVNDGLLAALAVAVTAWRARRGVDEPSALIRIEGHGREEAAVPGANLDRTVGWFTTVFPARFDLTGIDTDDAMAGGPAMGAALELAGQRLAALPDKGIGYGMLRYLSEETKAELSALPAGQVSFNYLGQVSGGDLPPEVATLGWVPADDLTDLVAEPDPDMPAAASIDINAAVADGRLNATVGFPAGLFDHADIEELAQLWKSALGAVAHYAETAEPEPEPDSDAAMSDALIGVVLPIRLTGNGAPLFCVHPASGLSWCYAGFAQLIEPGRPIYGLQAPELSGGDALRSVEAYADRYVAEMRTVQPKGPYNVLGWSLGGYIAQAIAVRLRELGEDVDLLAVLDADLDKRDVDLGAPVTPGELVYEYAPMFGVQAERMDLTAAEAANILSQALPGAAFVEAEHIERLTECYNGSRGMLAGYEPTHFDGDLVFFTPTQDNDDLASACASWRGFIGGELANHLVDSTHDRMAAPDALPEIARVINQFIGSARTTA
ncbi:non-ribosomal peptide synthetase [Antrihabitans stalactiti]|uniref:Amino acid adenylation domain-containing protein n=1 Tax=Antrihabitans stalactiti TaxID=2584121 RepID=A0A848KAG8_9NOCA|nr:non-ribosomal peptide synthetase [Antrihabitans stalactiti]NMN94234.1 amino acid adenylation domain-containing protein [Antrihabitans stalactiti]